jgi:hypothetical protein
MKIFTDNGKTRCELSATECGKLQDVFELMERAGYHYRNTPLGTKCEQAADGIAAFLAGNKEEIIPEHKEAAPDAD